jgi:hypothetical protein
MAMDLNQQRQEFDSAVEHVPGGRRSQLKSDFDALAKKYAEAGDEAKPGVEKQIQALVDEAKALADRPAAPTTDASWDPRYTLVLSIIVTAAYAAIVLTYFGSLKGTYTIESTRLLIVLTLIIAMLGFGGLLISRALFSKEGTQPLQERFRLAREIFLVFSGIFGTIIGFYFGATDEDKTAIPALEIGYANGQVTALVTGGAEPFLGIITPKDGVGSAMTVDKRMLSYAAAPCPEDASIVVVDGRGHRAETTVECGKPGTNAGTETNAAEGNAAEGNTVTTTDNTPDNAASNNGAAANP